MIFSPGKEVYYWALILSPFLERTMSITKKIAIVILLVLSPIASAKQTIVGYLEKVELYPGGVEIKVKVDSGATNSSLNCTCTEFFTKDGEEWVRFGVRNYKDETAVFEKKLIGYTKVKRHFGEVQRRPVIQLGICMAGVFREVKVNLVDRAGYNYQMLIGRSFMLGDFLISPDQKYLTKPNCPTAVE